MRVRCACSMFTPPRSLPGIVRPLPMKVLPTMAVSRE
jgi:hypothetical protein